MDLILNRELGEMARRLSLHQETAFKQDSKLAAAIDRLSKSKFEVQGNESNSLSLSLPERKLEFNEVRKLLSQQLPEIFCNIETNIDDSNEIRKAAIHKIKEILDGIKVAADKGETPNLVLRNQRLWSNCIYDLDRVTLKSFNEAKKTIISYSNNEDKKRFNTIVFVLSKIHELLLKNLTVTRRELFYQNVSRFRCQSTLDVAVRDVCCLLETPPWSLGLVATAKGLIAGPLTMRARDGSVVDCNGSGGTLIPQDVVGLRDFISTAKYILVVEKDAMFQKLLDEGALLRLGPVIIITGKGYPDVCTRLLLVRLCRELRLRALALVDADPHGIEIYLTYKYGSLAQSHLSHSLACSSISLLGARHQDIHTFAPKEALLRLTDLDKRKLNSLMKRPYLDTNSGQAIRSELQSMLTSGTKAELEALAPNSSLCDAYIPAKIISQDFLA